MNLNHIKEKKWESDNNDSKHLYLNSSRKKIRIKSIIDNKEKYSCSYLSACWQLCRLGVFKYPNINLINKENIKQTNEVINIFEKKYEIIEKKVKIIIKEIINLEKIDNIYFE